MKRLRSFFRSFFSRLLPMVPPPDISSALSESLRREADERKLREEKERADRLQLQLREMEIRARTKVIDEQQSRAAYEQLSELIEARQMAGAGPWQVSPAVLAQTDKIIADSQSLIARGLSLRENLPLTAGAYGDLGLAIQNVGWQRQVNIGQVEFSRYGIQQIILISRLNYVKSPIIRRLIDVCAAYVFARGVEISSPDEAVSEIIDDFVQANQQILGHRGLTKNERRKDYDGNLFFISFDDTVASGESKLRMIDATEIQDIWTNPDDASEAQYFHRVAAVRKNDAATGVTGMDTVDCWYPAYGFDPSDKPDMIQDKPVHWESPVYHVKCGEVAGWLFGCPRIYPAIAWSKETEKMLASAASVKASNAQIARDIATKGGQQAIEGLKAQLGTTVGPATPFLDMNPPAVSGATFAHGPGTDLTLVRQRWMSDDPKEVHEYKLMCCMVKGVPETFLSDVSTGNLATATSLDRPTETMFLEMQEEWREDLIALVMHYLEVSKNAPGGKLRECIERCGWNVDMVRIKECPRVPSRDGRRTEYVQLTEAQKKDKSTILVKVNFPEIREGDLQTLVQSTITSMTLNNRAGQVIGIDEKAGVRKLYDLLDFDDGDELVEQQYPEAEYEIDRTKEILPAPLERPKNFAAGTKASNIQVDADGNPVTSGSPAGDEADKPRESFDDARLRAAVARLNRVLDLQEAKNGHTHSR